MRKTVETLQKEKMKQVQLLATYYQLSDGLPAGEKRDQVIRDILACKHKIKKMNEELTALNKATED